MPPGICNVHILGGTAGSVCIMHGEAGWTFSRNNILKQKKTKLALFHQRKGRAVERRNPFWAGEGPLELPV